MSRVDEIKRRGNTVSRPYILLVLAGVLALPLLFVSVQLFPALVEDTGYELCTVLDESQLESALAGGFDVNHPCCAEHMIGECASLRPNSTPLIFAIENKNHNAVRLLLEHGADPNAASSSGFALSTAASTNQAEITKLLLEHGAATESKQVALRMAAHFGNTQVARLILSSIPSDLIPGVCAELACSLVGELDQEDSTRLPEQLALLTHIIGECVDPNASCGSNRLLSSLARKDEHHELIAALLERGADLDAKEANGKTVSEFIKSFWDYDSRPRIKALIESH